MHTSKNGTPAKPSTYGAIVQLPVYSSAFKANPCALYQSLAQQGREAVPIELPNGVVGWLVLGYDAAKKLLNDPRLSKDSTIADGNWHRHHPTHKDGRSSPVFQHLLTLDPPNHTHLRSLVQPYFVKSRIESLRPRVEALAEELLDAMVGKSVVDLISDYALPLPLRVICGVLGIPVADEQLFGRWSTLLVTAELDEQHLIPVAADELREYLVELARRGPEPGSLFADLVNLKAKGALSMDELTAMGFLLLVAGHETTINLIGNGVLALLREPDAWKRLCSGNIAVDQLVEELLRSESPIENATPRFAREDVAIGEDVIRRGQVVFIGIAAANRDERIFECPDQLMFDRQNPERHLGFGYGVHFCLGAPLARMEGHIAFDRLSRRFPRLALAVEPGALAWRPGPIMRGLRSLPLRLNE